MNKVAAEPSHRRLELLRQIYPSENAAALEQEIAALLTDPSPIPVRKKASWSEREVLLITYGDQVREEGVQPLRSLSEFLGQSASGLVAGVHLLPHFPSSSDDGFSVMDYHQVDPALGDWKDVAGLGKEFVLMFDAVVNHASAQGSWFRKFLDGEKGWERTFFVVEGDPDLSKVVRPRALPLLTEFPTSQGPRRVWTTFSADQADLDYRDPVVLLRVLEVLLFYVRQGASFLRLDAIAFLWKEPGTTCQHLPQTHAVVRLIRAVLDEWAPGVRIITETNVPHSDNISYFGEGHDEAHLVYNFALPPLALHTLASGNAQVLTRWAASLHLPSEETSFFNFLASHDGIGVNPARGLLEPSQIDTLVERAKQHGGFVSEKNNQDGTRSPYELNINYFDALSNPSGAESLEKQVSKFLCASAIQFCLRGIPGIYFHSLFGSRGDRSGADASGIPRRINRQKLQRKELEAELGNEKSLRYHVFQGMKKLLTVRAATPAFTPGASQRVHSLGPEWFAVERGEGGQAVLALCNVTEKPQKLLLPAGWKRDKLFCLLKGQQEKVEEELPPFEVLWLQRSC